MHGPAKESNLRVRSRESPRCDEACASSERRDSAQREPAQQLGSTARTPVGDHDQKVLLISELHDGRHKVALCVPIRNVLCERDPG